MGVKPVAWDHEVDVLCVGSGAGGLAASVTAAESGATALVVEKGPQLGGVTALSSGQIWVGASHVAAEAGILDDRADVLRYLEHLSAGLAVPSLREAYVDRGIATVRYLTDTLDIPLKVIRGLPDYYFPNAPGSAAEGRYLEVEPFPAQRLGDWAARCLVSPYGARYSYLTSGEGLAAMAGTGEPFADVLTRHLENDERCTGAGLAAHLLEASLARAVEFWTESAVVRLVVGDDGVDGAEVVTPSGTRRVHARQGVLLATGAYDWNKELVRSFEALPEAGSMAPHTVEGDHIVMASEIGAMVMSARAPSQTPIFVGYQMPGDELDGEPVHRGIIPGKPHSIIVNATGLRFCDDGFYPDVVTKVARFDGPNTGTPNWPAWLVFDDVMRREYGLEPLLPGAPLPEGFAHSAPTIRALADAVGIDADGLDQTIARFNGFCDGGTDDDFGRGTMPWGRIMTGDVRISPNPCLGRLEEAPFHAVRLERVGMGVGTAGLRTDEVARVLNARAEPIPRLYAAGNSAAWLDIGGGFNSGIAIARGLVFGHTAALDMTA
jgi:3-oxosteroid 1-dehydrogenase